MDLSNVSTVGAGRGNLSQIIFSSSLENFRDPASLIFSAEKISSGFRSPSQIIKYYRKNRQYFIIVRVGGIEPPSQPWEGRVMPLNYARLDFSYITTTFFIFQDITLFFNFFSKLVALLPVFFLASCVSFFFQIQNLFRYFLLRCRLCFIKF
jgi:hypothetical protein